MTRQQILEQLERDERAFNLIWNSTLVIGIKGKIKHTTGLALRIRFFHNILNLIWRTMTVEKDAALVAAILKDDTPRAQYAWPIHSRAERWYKIYPGTYGWYNSIHNLSVGDILYCKRSADQNYVGYLRVIAIHDDLIVMEALWRIMEENWSIHVCEDEGKYLHIIMHHTLHYISYVLLGDVNGPLTGFIKRYPRNTNRTYSAWLVTLLNNDTFEPSSDHLIYDTWAKRFLTDKMMSTVDAMIIATELSLWRTMEQDKCPVCGTVLMISQIHGKLVAYCLKCHLKGGEKDES